MCSALVKRGALGGSDSIAVAIHCSIDEGPRDSCHQCQRAVTSLVNVTDWLRDEWWRAAVGASVPR